jgi:hypothetical protein
MLALITGLVVGIVLLLAVIMLVEKSYFPVNFNS